MSDSRSEDSQGPGDVKTAPFYQVLVTTKTPQDILIYDAIMCISLDSYIFKDQDAAARCYNELKNSACEWIQVELLELDPPNE